MVDHDEIVTRLAKQDVVLQHIETLVERLVPKVEDVVNRVTNLENDQKRYRSYGKWAMGVAAAVTASSIGGWLIFLFGFKH